MQGYVHNVYRSHAHTILAVVIVPLISTRYRAWRGRFRASQENRSLDRRYGSFFETEVLRPDLPRTWTPRLGEPN